MLGMGALAEPVMERAAKEKRHKEVKDSKEPKSSFSPAKRKGSLGTGGEEVFTPKKRNKKGQSKQSLTVPFYKHLP